MIAFKTESQNPSKSSGMPDEWPWQECVIDDSLQSQYESNGWSCLSADAYVLYKAQYQSAYNTWYASQPNQFNADKERYVRRAAAKDGMIATLAAGNMARIRAGTWTVSQLISFMQDSVVTQILTDINTLSFELAYAKVDLISSEMVTTAIKNEWKSLLVSNFYN